MHLVLNALPWLLWIPAFWVPMFGNFGSYQAVNAMMAGSMAGPPLDLLRFETYGITKDGVPLLHLLYYPYGSALSAIGARIFHMPHILLAVSGKAIAALFLTGAALLFRSTLRIRGLAGIADTAMLLFLCLPMNLIYGASFQNETAALFFFMLAWRLGPGRPFLAGLFLGLAAIARIHFLALAIPLAFIFFQSPGPRRKLVLFVLGTALPVLVWMAYIKWTMLNSAFSAHHSLFGQMGQGRFLAWSAYGELAFWRGILTGILQLTAVLLIPYILRALRDQDRSERFETVAWIAAGVSVIFLLPRKVADHPFYLIVLSPWIAVMAAQGIRKLDGVWHRRLLLIGFAVLSIALAWQPVFKTHSASGVWLSSAQKIASVTESEDRVIFDHPQAAAMMFYANRRGWGVSLRDAGSLEDISANLAGMRALGARWIYLDQGNEMQGRLGLKEYLRQQAKEAVPLSGTAQFYEFKK